MISSEFLRKLRGTSLFSGLKISSTDSGVLNMNWKLYRYFANITSKIDIGCNFDNSGLCEVMRIRKNNECETSVMCCCSICSEMMGYFTNLERDIKIIKFIASKYDVEYGFWSKSGCVLPRRFRSQTCLGFKCFEIKNDDEYGTFLTIIDAFNDSIYSPDKDLEKRVGYYGK